MNGDAPYYQQAAALSTCEARALMLPREFEERCDDCGKSREDCETYGKGCVRCAECNGRMGECPEDCADGHMAGCDFPAERCVCKALLAAWRQAGADLAADQAFQAEREGA
jgi:hypothetical protein